MTSYNPIVQEFKKDREVLGKNHYNLQVAKSVSSPGGSKVFNVVYSSKFLGPIMSTQWTADYGLNWTTDVPTPGAKVDYSGDWQACSPGESFDLDEFGGWKAHPENPKADKDSLNVASNGYKTSVHIIVGVQDKATKKWAPIWVAPNALVVKGHGEYQPRESVQLWFNESMQDATMIDNQATTVKEFDLTTLHKYYFHYDAMTGAWTDQPTPFPVPADE